MSYVARMAHANHMTANQLRYYVAGAPHKHPRSDWLAIASGQPERTLRRRLRGFRFNERAYLNQTGQFRPMCRLCMARRGIHDPVYCTFLPHVTVCQRHQRWIGPPARTLQDQRNLRDQPRVLKAAHIHQRLGQHRDTGVDMVFMFRTARRFLNYWASTERPARIDAPEDTVDSYLATYPDLVGIAATLTTHRQQVREQTMRSRIHWPTELLQEINDRTGRAYAIVEPVEQWVHDQQLDAARLRGYARNS